MKPQDSNLHVWHVVLTSVGQGYETEIYAMLYIGSSDVEPIIVLHCLTPNGTFPPNRNVSLTHLSPLLVSAGLTGLLDHLQNLTSHTLKVNPKLMKAWNRIMIKDFQSYFPELCSDYSVNDEDYVLVQQWLNRNSERQLKPASFRFKDISQATTIACDNDGRDTKRQRTGQNAQQPTKCDHSADYELHRKKRL